ncbi:MAG TPA: tetratricopeptide repeat protein [Longimicrobiaceae bacterium]|nr:tetratricopeptide repeat protein [Longimicrobiaceae bacterium]
MDVQSKTVAQLHALFPAIGEFEHVKLALSAASERNPTEEWDDSRRFETLARRVVNEQAAEAALAEVEREAHQAVSSLYETARQAIRAYVQGDIAGASSLWISFGEQEEARGAFARARECYQQAAILSAPLREREVQILAIRRLGRAFNNLGQFEEGYWAYRRSAEVARDTGALQAEVIAHMGAGNARWGQNRYAEAEAHYREALERTAGAEEALRLERAQLTTNLARCAVLQHRFDEAEQWLREAEELWTHVESVVDRAIFRNARALLALEQGDNAAVRRHLEHALELPLGPLHRAALLVDLAESSIKDGNLNEATRYAREAEEHALQGGSISTLVRVYRALGNIARETNEDGVAFYEAALEMARTSGLRFDEAETLLQYAVLRSRMGGGEEARDFVATAEQILRDIDAPRDAFERADAVREEIGSQGG